MRRNFQSQLAQVAHLLSRKKKRIVAAAKNSNFSFLSLWKCNCKSLCLIFPFKFTFFSTDNRVDKWYFATWESWVWFRKIIHMFRQAYINFKIFYLIEYILPPITQFLKKNCWNLGLICPFSNQIWVIKFLNFKIA